MIKKTALTVTWISVGVVALGAPLSLLNVEIARYTMIGGLFMWIAAGLVAIVYRKRQ